MLETVEIGAKENAKASVIWLHGLGADGNDFVPIVPELEIDDLQIRFVFPHANVQPVTINGGMPMRAWYDIKGISLESKQDDAGIRASQVLVEELIQREKERGMPADKIILAGFSQGGAIALHTALRHNESLAGLLALSTYLPLHESLEAEASEHNKNIPIMMCHGSYDPVVPQRLGEMSRDLLVAQGYDVKWHSYPMQHQVSFDEIKDIGAWIRKTLSKD